MKKFTREVVWGRVDLWKNKKPLLESLIFELTERCNNNCVHCYINKPKDDPPSLKKELTTAEINHILDEAALLGCMNVRFTGGEPLLRKDFEQIYLHARKLGMMVEIFTNAILLTPRLVELFVRISPRRKIAVTVYGMSEEAYETVSRIPGSHRAAFRGIDRLLAYNVPFDVNTPILPQNMHEKEKMESWVSTHLGPKHPSGAVMFLSLHARRIQDKSGLIEKNRISPQAGLSILTRNRDEYIKGAQGFFLRHSSPPDSRLFTCGAGVGSGCVDAYGVFQMCTMLRHPSTVYDLKRGSLKDALTNFFPVIREIKADDPQYLARCTKCFLKSFCDHCPAQSWSAHGTLDAIDEYFCEVTHAEARFLGLLADNEKAWEVRDWKERLERFTDNSSLSETRKARKREDKENRDGKKCKN